MANSPHSNVVTEDIRIQAAAEFQPLESDPAVGRYFYMYKITMTNLGQRPARLLSRHWIILDSDGHRDEVKGPGVVGEYPKLGPADSYTYISYCPLRTSWGTMEGSYQFERDDGTRFSVSIGRFFLVPSAPPLTLESRSY
jgi:ApaG protein